MTPSGPGGWRRPAVIAIVFLAVLAGAAGVSLALRDDDAPTRDPASEGYADALVELTTADGEVRGHCVLVADTPRQRQRGLMQVTDLGRYEGMLFRFAEVAERAFWMRNTPLPLSIAYFDAAGRFVSARDMAPCGDSARCPTYRSAGPAQYALEVEQGRLGELGVSTGSRLAVDGPCAE